MASYLPEFPKLMAATALSDIDLKNIIFQGMPTACQENFVHAKNMCIALITLAQMTDYLASEQVIADARREKNNKDHGSQSGRGRSTGSREVLLQVKVMAIKEEDVANMAINVEVHGLVQMTVAMKPRTIRYYGYPDGRGPNYCPWFTPSRPHGATGRGCDGFRDSSGNGGGDWNDAYQNDAASNAGSNNHASPSAASLLDPDGSIMLMPLDGAPVISLLLM
eukprot:scaffold37681_cov54-Attheya_sp.AAC.3